jgi:hypothetical protein
MQFLIDRGIDMTIKDYCWNSTAQGWALYGKNDPKMAQWLEDANGSGSGMKVGARDPRLLAIAARFVGATAVPFRATFASGAAHRVRRVSPDARWVRAGHCLNRRARLDCRDLLKAPRGFQRLTSDPRLDANRQEPEPICMGGMIWLPI